MTSNGDKPLYGLPEKRRAVEPSSNFFASGIPEGFYVSIILDLKLFLVNLHSRWLAVLAVCGSQTRNCRTASKK